MHCGFTLFENDQKSSKSEGKFLISKKSLGSAAPEPTLRAAMEGSHCIRAALNELFVLSNPLGKNHYFDSHKTLISKLSVDYSSEPILQDCVDAGCEILTSCQCSLCRCCSVCTERCSCLKSSQDANIVMENILGFGDANYRYADNLANTFSNKIMKYDRKAQDIVAEKTDSDDSDEEGSDNSDDIDDTEFE